MRAKYSADDLQDGNDSGILVVMRGKPICLIILWMIAASQAYSAQTQTTQAPAEPGQPAPQTSPPNPPQTPAAPAASAVEPAPPPQKPMGLVIIDPAHGGADSGSRGSSGITESDVVLSYARLLRISLEAQGLRVILTRQANDDPSFDDRSRLANAQRGNIFITLHVSSTGQPGTVRVYSLPRMALPQNAAVAPRSGLLRWDRAQFNFIDQSRRLAELVQIQMAQRFRGSSETPFEAPVRQLRTVGAPAVAIEVSSVSLPDRGRLDQMGPGLADGVARAVAAFRTIYELGGR
ncbi:MAG TPA: N-acetylmuramoyl-L-alanine amidase [Candidatus Acidoferrum sp.]|jgi:N-acetylmuramoyl-L-alanine amidase|nr:N-acetylmuramoyl-L-alanine amidase [Candidatus Acidoferrum sp.]